MCCEASTPVAAVAAAARPRFHPVWVVGVYVGGTVIGGALLAPPLWWAFRACVDAGLAGGLADTPFRRVADRAFMLVAAIGFLPFLRGLGLSGRAAWGYPPVCRREMTRCLGGGLGIGLATLSLLVVAEYASGALVWDDRRSAAVLVWALVKGVGSGVAVSVIEETFFRGGLYAVFKRSWGGRGAIGVTAVLYAVAHYLRSRGDFEAVGWTSGFAVVGSVLADLGDSDMLGGFLALLAVGLFLGDIRERTGHVLATIGMHSGWVAVIAFGRKATNVNPHSSHRWLVDGYNGITGYLACFYVLALWLGYEWLLRWRARRRRGGEM